MRPRLGGLFAGGIIAALWVGSCTPPQEKSGAKTSAADSSSIQGEFIEEGADVAVAVVQEYYRAIQARDYQRAYRCWGESGPPGQTLEEFTRGFAATASVRVQTGRPSPIDAAAGSRYIDVPVEIDAKTTSGQEQHFSGKYILRRAVVDGATPAQRHWHFYRAEIRETKKD
ncbi:MAG TPA: hypothetical protein VFR10_12710 [bacterium]|nr:hypothetical protein [bacterium]